MIPKFVKLLRNFTSMTILSSVVLVTFTWAICGTLPSFEASQVAFSLHLKRILVIVGTGKGDLGKSISCPNSKCTSKYVGSEIIKKTEIVKKKLTVLPSYPYQ